MHETTQKRKYAKKKYPDYLCPRCGYSTFRKGDIRTHFAVKKMCPGLTDIELTPEIKEQVLSNRFIANQIHLLFQTSRIIMFATFSFRPWTIQIKLSNGSNIRK